MLCFLTRLTFCRWHSGPGFVRERMVSEYVRDDDGHNYQGSLQDPRASLRAILFILLVGSSASRAYLWPFVLCSRHRNGPAEGIRREETHKSIILHLHRHENRCLGGGYQSAIHLPLYQLQRCRKEENRLQHTRKEPCRKDVGNVGNLER